MKREPEKSRYVARVAGLMAILVLNPCGEGDGVCGSKKTKVRHCGVERAMRGDMLILLFHLSAIFQRVLGLQCQTR